jgi:alkanesulfonate monooxygenase SsuD/methylene tetrahydromethanopterin reductase-like flavin-dependent oxidoreductase (luciferase family)
VDIDVVARINVAVDDSLERAYDALRPGMAKNIAASAPGFVRFRSRGIDLPDEITALALDIGYTHDPERLRPLAERAPKDLIDQFAIAATPETLGTRLDRLVESGATQILVSPVPIGGDDVEPVIDALGAWASRRR